MSFVLNAEREALEWLDEATAGATRLRAPLRIEVVRPLTPEDFSDDYTPLAQPIQLREAKASHHHLAKLLAEGRSDVEASRITGYSPSYIGRLKKSPLFLDLLSHYTEVEELAATDYLGAMRATGMDALGELRKRLEENPKGFSLGQLNDAVKLLLVEPMKSEALRSGLGGTVAPIQISFVASPTPQAGRVEEGRIIEGERAE